VWECLVLSEKGRLVLLPDAKTWLVRALAEIAFREAPLTQEVALRSRSVEVSHQDPADRFLAATAAVYGLTLVTADERLIGGAGFAVLPNR
jgi:PIN domain nuclease of toxin-antitoxin system